MKELIRGKRNLWMYERIYVLFRILSFIDLEKIRKKYFSTLEGNILDIGVGDGGNYKYYNKNTKVTILDFENKMLEYAKKKVSAARLKNYKFVNADAQNLYMFDDEYFDAVIVIFLYCCSIPNPIIALKEAKRVLKKSGRLFVIAHVKSKNKILYLFQKIMEPFSQLIIGSEMTRDTSIHIKKAGFKIENEITTGGYDIFKVFVAKKL